MPSLHANPQFQPLLRELGLDFDAFFDDPRIRPWRSIRERENCTLDATLSDGSAVRLHIKRHRADPRAAAAEANAIHLLEQVNIPTTPLVAHGTEGRRSVLITSDLTGYADSEKLVQSGLPFSRFLIPTAELTARLHNAGLHHRDLYLCHFFARVEGDRIDLALIDAARVRHLPRFFARRWIVKDLAQFWYSTLGLPVTDAERHEWLAHYAGLTQTPDLSRLLSGITRKSNWIARHDARLRQKQPTRNVSIPTPGGQ